MKRIVVTDFILLLGVGLVFYGLYAVYPPAAFILIGAFFVYAGWPGGDPS